MRDYEKEIQDRLTHKIDELHDMDLESLKVANAIMYLYFEMKLNNVQDFRNFFATVLNCCDESIITRAAYNAE
jgi:hypothetical protein